MSEQNANRILSAVWPEWEITDMCCSGTYGEVYRIIRGGENSQLSSESALKIISIPQNSDELKVLHSEIEIQHRTQNCLGRVHALLRYDRAYHTQRR